MDSSNSLIKTTNMLLHTLILGVALQLSSGQVVITPSSNVAHRLPNGLLVFIPSGDKCQTETLVQVIRQQSNNIVDLREEIKNLTDSCPKVTKTVSPGPTVPSKPDGECQQMTLDLLTATQSLRNLHISYTKAEHELQSLQLDYNLQKSITSESCRRSFDAIGEAEVIYQDNSLGNTGVWMKDAASDDDKVWITKGYSSVSQLLEYKSEASLKSNENPVVFTLPFSCDGMGHVVYKGAFYCNKYNSNVMVRYDLKTGKIVERTLSGAHGARYSYGYYEHGNLYDQIDFEVDERGLWVIFPESSTGNRYMAFSKLDPDNLVQLQTWRTSVVKHTQGNAFMVCGTLYSTYHYSSSSNYIQYSFDSVTYQQKSHSIKFHTYDKDHRFVSLSYNPKENALLAWHYSAQSLIKYRLLSNFQ